jgi:hypothetical protein
LDQARGRGCRLVCLRQQRGAVGGCPGAPTVPGQNQLLPAASQATMKITKSGWSTMRGTIGTGNERSG